MNKNTEKNLLELVKLAEEKKKLDAQIKAQADTFKTELERIDKAIEKLQAEKAELVKMMGSAGLSTGRGRPVGSKNKPKAETTPAQSAETANVLNVLAGNTPAQTIAETSAPVAVAA